MRSVRACTVVIPYVVLAAAFMAAWIDPRFFGERTLDTLLPLAPLEFIIIHASALLSAMFLIKMSRRKRIAALVGLGVLYTLFAGGMSLVLESWWPVLAFWGLLTQKLLLAIVGDGGIQRRTGLVMIGWAMHMCWYIVVVFLAALPWPQLGMPDTAQVAGSTVEDPARVMVGGVLYFFGVACMYAWGYWMTRDPKIKENLISAFSGSPA